MTQRAKFEDGDWIGYRTGSTDAGGLHRTFYTWWRAGDPFEGVARSDRSESDVRAELVRRAEFDQVNAYWIEGTQADGSDDVATLAEFRER